jgi:hypothetical protein
MKKFFLAFSILLSFSFSHAEESTAFVERTKNTGTDPIEAMRQNGGGTSALGHQGVCADCKAHSKDWLLYSDTVKRSDGSLINEKEGPAKADGATK